MLNTWSASTSSTPPPTSAPMTCMALTVTAATSSIAMRTNIIVAPRSPPAAPAPCRIGFPLAPPDVFMCLVHPFVQLPASRGPILDRATRARPQSRPRDVILQYEKYPLSNQAGLVRSVGFAPPLREGELIRSVDRARLGQVGWSARDRARQDRGKIGTEVPELRWRFARGPIR